MIDRLDTQTAGQRPMGNYERLLSGFNICAKSGAFLLMDDEGITSQAELGSRFMALYRNTELGYMGRKVAPGYLQSSHLGLGLVRHIPGNRSRDLGGYEKTDFGRDYGNPAAILTLGYEFMFNQCVYTFLGQASHRGPASENAPLIRAQILMILATQTDFIRREDLVDRFTITKKAISENLLELRRHGLVQYEAVQAHAKKNPVRFELGELPIEDVTPVTNRQTGGAYRELTAEVAFAAQRLNEAGSEINIDKLIGQLPERLRTQASIKGGVSNMASGLEAQGFLIRGPFTGGRTTSRLIITNAGRAFTTEYLQPLERIAEDPAYFARTYGTFETEIMNNLRAIAAATAPEYAISSHSGKMLSHEDDFQTVIDSIFALPGLTLDELAELTSLNKYSIRNWLNYQSDPRIIIDQSTPSLYRYFPSSA